MIGIVYDRMVAVDTSAVIALHNPRDQFHDQAVQFFETAEGFVWLALNVTTHELFTRVRYDEGLPSALSRYDFMKGERFRPLSFDANDEISARNLLEKYHDQTLSFHDALCAVVMIREGIYKIFSFDRDFWIFGFEVLPGTTVR
ncbi:MAG: type II toxin-antitoxin system VapC family toxin [Terriglobia bacterium]